MFNPANAPVPVAGSPVQPNIVPIPPTPPVNPDQPSSADGQTVVEIPATWQDSSTGDYDYSKALEMSLLFYEAQRSGKLPSSNRIPWRGDSLVDIKGATDLRDVSGGYYDAGDNVKFNLPMAWTLGALAWSVHEFKEVGTNCNGRGFPPSLRSSLSISLDGMAAVFNVT